MGCYEKGNSPIFLSKAVEKLDKFRILYYNIIIGVILSFLRVY